MSRQWVADLALGHFKVSFIELLWKKIPFKNCFKFLLFTFFYNLRNITIWITILNFSMIYHFTAQERHFLCQNISQVFLVLGTYNFWVEQNRRKNLLFLWMQLNKGFCSINYEAFFSSFSKDINAWIDSYISKTLQILDLWPGIYKNFPDLSNPEKLQVTLVLQNKLFKRYTRKSDILKALGFSPVYAIRGFSYLTNSLFIYLKMHLSGSTV